MFLIYTHANARAKKNKTNKQKTQHINKGVGSADSGKNNNKSLMRFVSKDLDIDYSPAS